MTERPKNYPILSAGILLLAAVAAGAVDTGIKQQRENLAAWSQSTGTDVVKETAPKTTSVVDGGVGDK